MCILATSCNAQVANLPKKHEKLLVKSMAEENWKAKIPEKVRCVFHFADQEGEEGKLVALDSFKASQVRLLVCNSELLADCEQLVLKLSVLCHDAVYRRKN